MKKAFFALGLLMTPLSVPAAGLDIGLSNDSANIAVLLNPYSFNSGGGGSELALGGFLNETGDQLLFASLMAQGIRKLPNQQYNIGAGFKLLAGDVEINNELQDSSSSESVSALAIGFKAGYVIPARQNPLEIILEGYIAPSITSFSNADMFTEVNARVQVEVIPQAIAYIGYRRINFDTEDFDSVVLDNNVHLGFKLAF